MAYYWRGELPAKVADLAGSLFKYEAWTILTQSFKVFFSLGNLTLLAVANGLFFVLYWGVVRMAGGAVPGWLRRRNHQKDPQP